MKIRHSAAAVLSAAALTFGVAAPATTHAHRGHHIQVTTGEFQTLPGGTEMGYDIEGRAVMVRLPHRTFVAAFVGGLDAGTSYPTHVHNAPCSADPPGGSHYQHQVGGPVDTVNEMWPIVATNRRGWGHGHAAHAHRARPDAQSIVIHYPEDTKVRLACVDLT